MSVGDVAVLFLGVCCVAAFALIVTFYPYEDE